MNTSELSELLIDGMPVDYSRLPESHRETARLYLNGGYQPGSGWNAILSNDLRAVVMVDQATFEQLPAIYRWMVNYAPSDAWGSVEKVQAWMSKRRALRNGGVAL